MAPNAMVSLRAKLENRRMPLISVTPSASWLP